MASSSSEIVGLVEEVIGVSLMDDEIERTLIPFARKRSRALGLRTPEAYLRRLESEPRGGREWTRLIGAVTNGQTCFFRDQEQFATLRRLLRAAARQQPGRRIAIWSSACSTGEEPYSIAMVCAELGISAQIVGSDVNPASLDRALAGAYRPWSLRNVSEARADRWFARTADGYQIDSRLRTAVMFVRHNLVRDPPLASHHPDGRWDIVLCRNVLIYFRRERVARVCARLVRSLDPGGAFVIAASESLSGLEVPARPEMIGGRIVYRKAGARPPKPAPEPRLARPRPPAIEPTPTPPPRRDPRPPRAASEPPVLDASAVLDRVARLAIDGPVETARQVLDEAIKGTEPGIEVHLAFGHLAMCEHDFGTALERYTQASEIDFLLCEVHYFLGLAHRKRSEWRSAVDALRRALFLAPTFWQASYLLASTYQRLGRSGDAAREQARTRALLAGPPPIVTFLSHPLFVERLGVQADEVRRLWAIWQLSGSRST